MCGLVSDWMLREEIVKFVVISRKKIIRAKNENIELQSVDIFEVKMLH